MISKYLSFFSYNWTTRCADFSKFHFGMNLYMFRKVPLSIITSFPLYTQLLVYVIQVCWQLASRSICSCSQAVSQPVWHIPLLSVQWKTRDVRQRNSPKHVELHSKIKFWEISASNWCNIRSLSRCEALASLRLAYLGPFFFWTQKI